MRYLLSSAGAVAVTVALFLLMQSLIAMSEAKLSEDTGQRLIDFVRLKHESSLQTKKRALPERQQLQQQPKPPSMNLSESPDSGAMGPAISVAPPSAPTMEHKVHLTGGPTLGGAPQADTNQVPLVRVNPIYPRSAAERRIQGWVLLRFTISTVGTVKDAQVVSSQPARVFDRAALQAVRKWRYKPRIVDGAAVETPNQEVRLTFELED